MDRELQKYIRESFPEHSELTVSEIFLIKHKYNGFINYIDQTYGISDITDNFLIKEFFIIDLVEFFDKHENKISQNFANANSFQLNLTNEKFSVNLHNSTEDLELFFKNDIKKNDISLIYKNEIFEYNQCNFNNCMFKLISSLDKQTNAANLLSSFLLSYLEIKTDLGYFFEINLINNKITIATHYNLFYLNESNNPKKNNINIVCANNYISILDYNSNILLKKEIKQITKDNFLNEIIEPLKNIIVNMDNIRKEQFQTLWKQDLYHYLSLCLFLDKQELDVIQIEVFQPEIKSKFLDLTPHTTRPKMEILFLLNNNVASSCLIDETNKYNDYYKEILDSYNIYKSIEEADSERMELSNIIDGKEKESPKIKRI